MLIRVGVVALVLAGCKESARQRWPELCLEDSLEGYRSRLD